MEGMRRDVEQELSSVRLLGKSILYLNYKRLEELPELLVQDPIFKQVQHIYLTRNLLKALPEKIGCLKGLVELCVRNNDLCRLPDDIGGLSNLRILDISENHLETLPASIAQLKNLETFMLSNNNISHLPKELGGLKKLATLMACGNNIASLPTEIFDCQSLRNLFLDKNLLQHLSRQIIRLQALQDLSVCGNHLPMLPLNLLSLPSLESVSADSNHSLTSIPYGLKPGVVSFYGIYPDLAAVDFNKKRCHVVTVTAGSRKHEVQLPEELRRVGHPSSPISLLELSFRQVYRNRQADRDLELISKDIPLELASLLTIPTTQCIQCQCPVFVEAFPVICEPKPPHPMASLIVELALCCSSPCVSSFVLIEGSAVIFPEQGE